MVIKVIFDCDDDYDYIYVPQDINMPKHNIERKFYKWIDNPKEDHPFWEYDDEGEKALCYRGDAIVYWLNKYIINNKENGDTAKLLDSFSSKNLEYDLEIRL